MIKVNQGNAKSFYVECDLVVTDPPFDMGGNELAEILDNATCNHLVLITTMKQYTELMLTGKWTLNFDFVLDAVVPKKSKSIHQPNYTHSNGFYLTRNNSSSIFNRKLKQRSDTFDNNGYWPSIIRAPRERLGTHGMAKNLQAVIDIIGCFDANHIYDPFAGSGTTGFACLELDRDCTLTELDIGHSSQLKKEFAFYE